MTHVRRPNPATATQSDASDAIRRAALEAWVRAPEAKKHAAWAHLHAIGMVSPEEPEPEPPPRKHWWSNDYD